MSFLSGSVTAGSAKMASHGHSGSQSPQSYTLIPIDLELVRESLLVRSDILVDAVYWVDTTYTSVSSNHDKGES